VLVSRRSENVGGPFPAPRTNFQSERYHRANVRRGCPPGAPILVRCATVVSARLENQFLKRSGRSGPQGEVDKSFEDVISRLWSLKLHMCTLCRKRRDHVA